MLHVSSVVNKLNLSIQTVSTQTGKLDLRLRVNIWSQQDIGTTLTATSRATKTMLWWVSDPSNWGEALQMKTGTGMMWGNPHCFHTWVGFGWREPVKKSLVGNKMRGKPQWNKPNSAKEPQMRGGLRGKYSPLAWFTPLGWHGGDLLCRTSQALRGSSVSQEVLLHVY